MITLEDIELSIKEYHLRNGMTQLDFGNSFFEIKLESYYKLKKLYVSNMVDKNKDAQFEASSIQDLFFDVLDYYEK